MVATKTRRKPAAKKARTVKPTSATKAKAVKKTPKPRTVPARNRKPPVIANGITLVSVFGPFNSRVLVEMSAERAHGLLDGQPLNSSLAPTRVIDATLAEIADLAKREKGLAESALAASAIALAYEIENPFNSATSKSMCSRELRETMKQLHELAPEQKTDRVDDLTARRDARRRRAS